MNAKPEIPNDAVALYLAPVALAVDNWLEHHGAMPTDEVRFDIALATNTEPSERPGREQALVDAVIQSVPTHGWELAVTPRGLRLSHRTHAVTLGLPQSVSNFLDA